MKKKVTLSLEDSVYSSFQKYCEENGLMLSKQIELMIKGRIALKKIGGVQKK